MDKKLVVVLSSVIFVLAAGQLSFAGSCGCGGNGPSSCHPAAPASQEPQQIASAAQAVSKAAVNVGNKICPVSGEKVESMSPVTYEYEGKIYNFCCPACVEEFKKDPQKYIKKVAEELSGKPQK